MSNKTNSGILEFSDDQKVFVSVKDDDTVTKAVLIDREGDETPLAELSPGALALYAKWSEIAETNKKIKLIAGAIRNTGTGWVLINDDNHTPLNIESVVGGTSVIRINYAFEASKVISFIIASDETYAGVYDVGASVGKEYADIDIYAKSRSIGGYVYYDGEAWDYSYSKFTGASMTNGILTLNHENLNHLTNQFGVCAIGRNCQVIADSVGSNFITVKFLGSDGSVKTTPDDSMKVYAHRIITSVPVNPTLVQSDSGNFWFIGVMEVDDESEE